MTTRTLVGYVHYPETLSYAQDWLEAFVDEPALDVVAANLATPVGRRKVRREAETADLVVLLHTVVGNSLDPIRRCRDAVLGRKGPLVAFVANEVSLPGQPLAEKIQMLRDLAPQFVATQLLLDTGEHLYADVGAKVVAVPHALNPVAYRSEVPGREREIDVGFRGARYLSVVGDDERNRIIDYFAHTSFDPPLITDVRTNVSYDRRGWAQFLNRCRGIVGAEAGAIEVRPDDADLAGGRGLRASLRPIHRYLPRGVKNQLRRAADKLTRSEEVLASVGTNSWSEVTPKPGATGRSGKCVSSRHFEAIGTETCQILFPGRYNDLLVADEHYLRLEHDFSNIDDVLARLRDDGVRTQMVRTTREWALEHHTHRHRVRALLDAVGVS
jgi:glycosyl transferase family 1